VVAGEDLGVRAGQSLMLETVNAATVAASAKTVNDLKIILDLCFGECQENELLESSFYSFGIILLAGCYHSLLRTEYSLAGTAALKSSS
jgi:hypothetical protein